MSVVYTAIIGPYDRLLDPTRPSPGVRHVCFTDQPFTSQVWEIVRVDPETVPGTNARRKSRWFKFHPHELFPHQQTAWLDGRGRLVGDVRGLWEHGRAHQQHVAMLRHPKRDCVYAEYRGAFNRSRERERLKAQMDRYKAEGLPAGLGLFAGGFIVSQPEAADFWDALWSEYESGGDRDQIALVYTSWKTGFPLHRLPGGFFSGRYVRWTRHHVRPEAP